MMFFLIFIKAIFFIFCLFYWVDFQVMIKYQEENIEGFFQVIIIITNLSFLVLMIELILYFLSKKFIVKLLSTFIIVKVLFLSIFIYCFFFGDVFFQPISWLFYIGNMIFSVLLYLSIKNRKNSLNNNAS